jgi:hypothetical protein
VLWIRDFLGWIRICGSVPLTNGSRSESCKFIAHLVRSQVTELREGSLFMFADEAGYKFSNKKKKLRPVSDLDPNPKPTSGRIRIRNRIRNFCFGSATLSLKPFSEFPYLWLVDVLKSRPLIGCRENAQRINLSQVAFGDFTESQAASCKRVQCQYRNFKALKRVAGRIFKISMYVISKEQAKTLSLIFSSTKKQKSAHVQKVSIY